jgi:hypothetical protein
MLYLRWESPVADALGRRVGIFGLANVLARTGALSPRDWALWRAGNDWYDAAYLDPGTVDPAIFDREIYPRTSCWFKESATHLLERVPETLALLDRYGVAWVRRESLDPGIVIYEDPDQIVVVPHEDGAAASLTKPR